MNVLFLGLCVFCVGMWVLVSGTIVVCAFVFRSKDPCDGGRLD